MDALLAGREISRLTILRGKKMAEIRFDDGRIVNLSEETIERLCKELFKDDKQLKVDRFRVIKHDSGCLFALMKYGNDVWDEKMKINGSNAEATHYLMRFEVQEIIAGLRRIINE